MNVAGAEEGEGENKRGAEHAIYDNGDVNSKANKFVAMVQENINLSDDEKERLLKNQELNLENIKSLMEKEKVHQEQEFDRVLKERLDRRRRLKEK